MKHDKQVHLINFSFYHLRNPAVYRVFAKTYTNTERTATHQSAWSLWASLMDREPQ
jgi:hypothetical protein